MSSYTNYYYYYDNNTYYIIVGSVLGVGLLLILAAMIVVIVHRNKRKNFPARFDGQIIQNSPPAQYMYAQVNGNYQVPNQQVYQ